MNEVQPRKSSFVINDREKFGVNKSKEFFESKESTKRHEAKDYFKVTDKNSLFRMTMNSGSTKWYAYCTDCRNMIFLEERENPEKYFFKHHRDYVDSEAALLSCSYYFPYRGKFDQDTPLPVDLNDSIARYAVDNAFCLYMFIEELVKEELIFSEVYFARNLGKMFLKCSGSDLI